MLKVYGIPEDVWRCPGCRAIVAFLEENEIEYEFIPVVFKTIAMPYINYHRDIIRDIAQRSGATSLRLTYPVVFDDSQYIGGYKATVAYLTNLGLVTEDE